MEVAMEEQRLHDAMAEIMILHASLSATDFAPLASQAAQAGLRLALRGGGRREVPSFFRRICYSMALSISLLEVGPRGRLAVSQSPDHALHIEQ